MGECYSRLCEVRGDGSHGDREIFNEINEKMKSYRNFKTSFVSNMLTDALRLKSGSSCGIAVKANTYPEIGAVGHQQDVDFASYARTVEDVLGHLITDDTREGRRILAPLSCVVRGSLKLDFYEWQKVHREPDQVKTRLIFGSCLVRNGVMRSMLQPVFELAVQDGLFKSFSLMWTGCASWRGRQAAWAWS